MTRPVISYCDIPEDVTPDYFDEHGTDVFIEYHITSKDSQGEYDDDFALDNWIMMNYPELENQKVLIHIDY